MRRKNDELTVIPDKARLYQQRGSRNYYCRIRLDNGTWERKATGTDDIDEARAIAHGLYREAQWAAQHNFPQTTRTFSGVAKAVVQQLEEKKGTTQWKQTYKHYIGVLSNYAIPYFRSTPLNQLQKKSDGYFPYVIEQLGHEPTRSTVATHTSALNYLFDYATQRNLLTENTTPDFRYSGIDTKQRETFELGEYRTIINKLNAWRKKPTHRNKDAEIRHLLYDYVLILANTGIRHGREAMDIRWQHLSFPKSPNGHPLTVFNVEKRKGRKGTRVTRKVVMRDTHGNAINILNRLKNRQEATKDFSVEQLIKTRSDKYIFALSDGSRPARMDGTFKKFLEDNNLLIGENGGNRSLYSWRHFYATTELTRKREKAMSIALLAQQLGTSIKMIEGHYGHLDVVKEGDALSGRTDW